MSTLLIATNNPGKVREFEELLAGVPVSITFPARLELVLEVDECGDTFEENARIKALAYAQASGLLTLADDSGLEVDFLDGAPGVRSARYAGQDATDQDRNRKLLAELANVPASGRSARCVRCSSSKGRADRRWLSSTRSSRTESATGLGRSRQPNPS